MSIILFCISFYYVIIYFIIHVFYLLCISKHLPLIYLFNNNYYKISPATNTNVLRHNFSMILSSSVPHPVACLQTPRLQSLPVSMTSDDKHLVSTSAKLLQKYCLHSWIKAEPGCKCTMHCTKWGEFESFSLLFTQGFF